MSRFKAIEDRENCEAARRKLEEETTKIARDKLLACKYRKLEGFFNIKCKHPERTPGRQCVNFECPVIDFI